MVLAFNTSDNRADEVVGGLTNDSDAVLNVTSWPATVHIRRCRENRGKHSQMVDLEKDTLR